MEQGKKSPPPVAPKPSKPKQRDQLNEQETQNNSTTEKDVMLSLQPEKPEKPVSSNKSELELDALTHKLMNNMNQASQEPDFVGVCSKCDIIIKGLDEACTALDRFYHSGCFTCQTCDRILSGHSFYAITDKVLCEGCYVNTLEKCTKCHLPVTERILRATGKAYHPECFICTHCEKKLDGLPFTVDAYNKIHCIEDFHMKYAPRCNSCKQAILPDSDGVETVRIVALEKNFHVACYKCEDCKKKLSVNTGDDGCYPLHGVLLCKSCNRQRLGSSGTSSGQLSPVAYSDM